MHSSFLPNVKNPEPNAFEEINILKALRHDHIVLYLTSFTDTAVRGRLCIVMEFCGYGNLTNAVRDLKNPRKF